MKSEQDQVVQNNEAQHRFEMVIGDEVAHLAYSRKGDTVVFTHTEVPTALEGQGLASKLARTALDYARAAQLQVVPTCSFIASYIKRHQEYLDIVEADYRKRLEPSNGAATAE